MLIYRITCTGCWSIDVFGLLAEVGIGNMGILSNFESASRLCKACFIIYVVANIRSSLISSSVCLMGSGSAVFVPESTELRGGLCVATVLRLWEWHDGVCCVLSTLVTLTSSWAVTCLHGFGGVAGTDTREASRSISVKWEWDILLTERPWL